MARVDSGDVEGIADLERSVERAERANAPMRWEDTDQVPFAYYANGGTYEWLFLENARSFEAKLRLMQEKKLRGFSAWVLGLEDDEIWQKLAVSK